MFDTLQLKDILSQIGEAWSPRNKETICEALWQYYSECNPAQDPHVIQAEGALEPYFQGLSPDVENGLFGSISELCVSYQRAAFLDGLRFAFRLHDELT